MSQPGDVTVINTLSIQNNAAAPIVRGAEVSGGYHTVADLAARDALPAHLRVVGMVVFVIAADQHYRLVGGTANVNWTLANFGSSTKLPKRDAFTPTNGQDVFTLSETPAVPDTLLFVVNNAVYTTQNGITIVGTTLSWLGDFTITSDDQVQAIYTPV